MGLMDEVLAMAGSSGTQQTEHTTAITAIMSYINSPQVGGIAGLQSMFQQGGLGHIVSSWISSGQKLPISPDQLQNVLHSGALAPSRAASRHESVAAHSSMMSSLLPHLVNKLTPNGQVPDASALSKC